LELSRKQLVVISTASSVDLNTIGGAVITGKARKKGVATDFRVSRLRLIRFGWLRAWIQEEEETM
jgi:hypothetical protein